MEKIAVPEHVPADRVVDFDYKRLPGGDEDVLGAWTVLYDAPEIVWSPYNGGHWIATRAETIEGVINNWELFSSKEIAIPPNETPNLPLEVDPPIHGPMRALISPLFSPATLQHSEKFARTLAGELIDGFIADGRCEFRDDFAQKLPIYLFLHLVDLPRDDAPMLLEWAEMRARSPEGAVRDHARRMLISYLGDKIEHRRDRPGEDFLSKILQGTIDGRRLTPFEERNILGTVMSGGLDTVASMLGFMMLHLARSPDHRAQLRADPALIPKAVNEIIRAHGVVSNARIVLNDGEYRGLTFKAGDRMLLPTVLAGLDAAKYSDPATVDYGRANASTHLAFGGGPHRCPGANLARMEMKVTIEEWLKRIPDFDVAAGEPVVYGYGAVTNSVNRLVLEWNPAVSQGDNPASNVKMQ